MTEMVTGVDLVQWMLRIANGEPLTLTQSDVRLSGSACEMRINAEDPEKNFFPCPGLIDGVVWPGGEGIRIDSHVFSGYRVPPWYDSLLAKVIALLGRGSSRGAGSRTPGRSIALNSVASKPPRRFTSGCCNIRNCRRVNSQPPPSSSGLRNATHRLRYRRSVAMVSNPIRYSFGGDEHLFAEIEESMSLSAFFRGLTLTRALEACQLPGVLDICLANASFRGAFQPG